MASIDKTSVRNEVARLKSDFEQLSSNGKVAPEVKVVMNSMFMIIELILTIFLEKVTKKNNNNSSLPSSQTEKDESALSQQGSNGKGKTENTARAKNTRTKETVTVAKIWSCDICGEDLKTTPCHHYERRTKVDIVFEKVVEHVDAEVKQCPTCDSMVKGSFPSDLHGPMQYGDGLKAFAINLLVCQMVALNRVQKLVKSMIGVVVAEASLLKFILRLHQALATWEQNAIEQILKMPAINVDETSLRVDKKNHWIHIYSAGDITLKRLHRSRGIEAINSINIIPRYGGVTIHDCWSAYFSYDNVSYSQIWCMGHQAAS
jgi:transposase